MIDREPEIVEVATTRLGRAPGPRGDARRPRSVVLVLLLAVAIPALAFIGPRIEWRPQIDLSMLQASDGPSPTPTQRSTPRSPAATSSPPPALTVGEGERPGRIPLDSGGIRFLDPSTGSLTEPGSINLQNDAAIASPDGGWWCVCFWRAQGSQQERVEMEVRHLDSAAIETARHQIRATVSAAEPPAQDFWTRLEVEFGLDGRTAYVASGVRTGNRWTVALEVIDLARGASLDRVELGTIDVPPTTASDASEGYESYLGGPTVRLAPDGRRLIMGAWLEKPARSGPPLPPDPLVWLVDVGDGDAGREIGPVVTVTGDLDGAYSTCSYSLQWLTDEALLGACWRQGDNVLGPAMSVTTFGLDGAAVSSIDYAPDQTWWTVEPILDRANRAVYFWSPVGHLLDRIDLASARVDRVSVDPDVESDPPASGTEPRRAPDWTTFTSDFVPWSSPQLFGEPGGERIFALGLVEGPPETDRGSSFGSSGIWVFDAATLQLIDRWPAAAAYTALDLTRDGRWMVAIGQEGVDTAGKPSAWPYSVTVHDARDGRLALQAGDVGNDGVLVVP